MSELKPCPWGGGVEVVVKEAGLTFPQVVISHVNRSCFAHTDALYYDTEDEAIAAWNNCPEPERPVVVLHSGQFYSRVSLNGERIYTSLTARGLSRSLAQALGVEVTEASDG